MFGFLGCGCLFAMLIAAMPRVAFLLLWIFTNYVTRAFEYGFVPLMGMLFLPFTSLMYVLVYQPVLGHPSGWGWVVVLLGFGLDIANYAGSAYQNKEQIETVVTA